jgi:DNA (cytosine-5)-methyltransferase 1
VREAARLQGLPDRLKIEGTLTSTQLQVGNAVPVELAKAVFEQVVRHAQSTGLGNRPLKAFSLFSGAGGMDIGAESTLQVNIRVALDSWSDACVTLGGFFRDRVCVLEKDISSIEDPLRLWQITSGEVNSPDLVFGGPPCQAFSQAGKQRGFKDFRGSMIFEFLRFVERLNPPFFCDGKRL